MSRLLANQVSRLTVNNGSRCTQNKFESLLIRLKSKSEFPRYVASVWIYNLSKYSYFFQHCRQPEQSKCLLKMTPNQVEFPNDRNRPEAFVTSDLGTRVREYFTTILQLHTVIYNRKYLKTT